MTREPETTVIVLIGHRGCGKSTVGRLLAHRLGWTFVDTDLAIAARAGRNIAEIFERDGEARFRELETEVIGELDPAGGMVVSVGGGALANTDNRRHLARLGRVVWLTATAGTLWDRVSADPRTAHTRPALSDAEPAQELLRLLMERTPLYAGLAEYRVDTTDLSPAEVAEMILQHLRL